MAVGADAGGFIGQRVLALVSVEARPTERTDAIEERLLPNGVPAEEPPAELVHTLVAYNRNPLLGPPNGLREEQGVAQHQ